MPMWLWPALSAGAVGAPAGSTARRPPTTSATASGKDASSRYSSAAASSAATMRWHDRLVTEDGRGWRLARGDVLLPGLVVTGGDFPWLQGQVRPTAEFVEVRPLFEEELRRLDHLDEETGPVETA